MDEEIKKSIENIMISLSNNKCIGCIKYDECNEKKENCEEYEEIKFKHCYTCIHSTIANRLGNCYCDIRHKDYDQTSLLADDCNFFQRASDEKELCTERCDSFYSKRYCFGKSPCKFMKKTVGMFDDYGEEKITELPEPYKEEL